MVLRANMWASYRLSRVNARTVRDAGKIQAGRRGEEGDSVCMSLVMVPGPPAE